MRKYIEDQLKMCAFAKLRALNNSTTSFIIPKYTKPKYDVGQCYIIQISPLILNNPNSVTAVNWNSGKYPKSEYMKAYVEKTMGKMIFVDCLAYNIETSQDLTEMWSGWLSIDEITQLAHL